MKLMDRFRKKKPESLERLAKGRKFRLKWPKKQR